MLESQHCYQLNHTRGEKIKARRKNARGYAFPAPRTYMETGKNALWGIAAIALIIGFFGGWQYGKQNAMQKADTKIQELEKSLNAFLPPLPEVISVIGGTIRTINGDSLTVEIPSFTNRYPKLGESPATETKTIRFAKDTKISGMNFDPKTFKNGLPQTITISASDLKIGDAVSVTIKENARTEQNLTATEIIRSGSIGL